MNKRPCSKDTCSKGAGGMKVRLQGTSPEAMEVVTVAVSKLKRSKIFVWNSAPKRQDRHNLMGKVCCYRLRLF